MSITNFVSSKHTAGRDQQHSNNWNEPGFQQTQGIQAAAAAKEGQHLSVNCFFIIATKNKEKTPPEACESGGRWPHWDGSRRQRPKQRTTDNETEECRVCKRKFKKGRGLNIHMAKSRCGKVTDQHRNTNKSEATNIPQDINHSGDGSRADRKPHREAKTSTRKDTERKSERPIQMKAGKGAATATEKKTEGEPTSTESNQEEATEIHVEEDLYNEVNLWVKNELERGDPKEPPKKKAGKQPILSDWLIKKDGRERVESLNEKK